MSSNLPNPRISKVEVDARFPDRWSPRAFLAEALTAEQVGALLEASRWAPSAFNEQPWRIVWATESAGLEFLKGFLMDANRVWADKVPFLAFFVAKTRFSKNGKPNPTALFDCGAAWMSMALQARALGLYAHGMSGIQGEKLREALGLDAEGWQVVAAVAVGKRGDAASLPEGYRAMEALSDRHPLENVAKEVTGAVLNNGKAELAF